MLLADSSSIQLLTSGPVPGWAGLLLFLITATFGVWQLRREFRLGKQTPLTRYVLPGLRILIVGLFVWLLCQPVLLMVRRWTPAPEMLLIVDSGNSMRVNESAAGISHQLDALDAVGQAPIAKRNNAASRLGRASADLERAAVAASQDLREELDAAATGLPLGPSVARKLDAFVTAAKGPGDELSAARALLPTDIEGKELKQGVLGLAGNSQVLGTSLSALTTDAPIIASQASKSPSLLDAFLGRLKTFSSDAADLRKRASEVQEKLDKALLTPQQLEQVRARPVTRQSLANMASDLLTAPRAGGPTWEVQRSPAVANALDDAFHRTLRSPLAGVILLSDGSTPVRTGSSQTSLTQLKVPVSTVLIGTDNQEPADAGLVAVDVPRLALAGDPVTIRCLVKNLVSSPAPVLTVSIGRETIGSRELALNTDGYDIVEFAWTPNAAGRFQLNFNVASPQPDAYPGNESGSAIVDVVSGKARVLVVSDALSSDFAASLSALSQMPGVELHSILSAPGISKFKVGTKSEEFPGAADDFKALTALVLMGDVPEGATPEALTALKQAVDAGLRVWVQAPKAGSSKTGKSWLEVLGIEFRPIDGEHTINPIRDLWLDLYQLGPLADDSQARWKALPPAACLNQIVATGGLPLLESDDQKPVMLILSRKAGSIVAVGISDLTSLRSPASSDSVNRLLSESLALALQPMTEPGQPAGVFPAQPVLGKYLFAFGAQSGAKGLDQAITKGASVPDGADAFGVTGPDAIQVPTNSGLIERSVRRLTTRQDFQLAAHGGPLARIAGETGGRHRDLLPVMDVVPNDLKGTPRISTSRLPLWPGSWSLVLLLGLVSSEYLLRRRAGKVM